MRLGRAIDAVPAAVILASLFGVATSALAQNVNETVGLLPNHLFESEQVGENVDILNGGLNLSVPIGSRYQLGRYLSYQLQLSYGSKFWDQTGSLHGRSNMGLGFNMHFGRLYKEGCTWYFVTPDGGHHALPEGQVPCHAPIEGYTADTTYYQLNNGFNLIDNWSQPPTLCNPSGAPVLRIRSPNGRLMYELGHMVQVYTSGGTPINCDNNATVTSDARNYNRDFGGWYVTKIYEIASGANASGSGWNNYVEIVYDTTGHGGAASHAVKEVRDNLGRKIAFDNVCEPAVSPDTGCRDVPPIGINNPERVSVRTEHIHVPAFKASSGVENPTSTLATFDLGYQWIQVGGAWVNVLKSITYPDHGAHGGTPPRYTMQFGYENPPVQYGELNSRTLPTGAKIVYQWGDYYYAGPTQTRALTAKEILIDPGVNAGRWDYERQSEDPYIPGTYLTNPRSVTVTDPVHNDTVYHYRASASGHWNDGLNYRVEYYEGTGPTKTLRRLEELEYESDLDGETPTGKNIRLNRQTTAFVDDGGKKSIAQYRDWSGLGLWREVVESGDGIEGTRITRTEYNGGDPTVFAYREVSDGTKVLSRVDNAYRATLVGSLELALSIERLTLPTAFGTPASTTALPGDIVTVYHYIDTLPGDPTNAVQKIEVGNQGVSGTGPWAVTNASLCARFTYHQAGLLATKTFYDCATEADFPWLAIDVLRDPNTGLVFKSEDPAGVATNYRYDRLGRVIEVIPDLPELATQVQYSVSNDSRKMSVRQGPGNTFGCDAVASGDFLLTCNTYDGLGRLIQAQRRAPDVNKKASYQKTRYDLLGRTTFRSEWMWQDENPCGETSQPPPLPPLPPLDGGPPRPVDECGTTYDYTDPSTSGLGEPSDPFGRVRKVITADNETAIASYFGQNSVVTLQGVVQAGGLTPDLVTTYFRDVWGRLVEVIPPPSGGAHLKYTYDLRDNMVEAVMTDQASLTVQKRSFEYDALNRIHVAVLPESGAAVVTGYDAIGNATSVKDAAGNETLRAFDGAGRLRTVQWKEYPKPGSPAAPVTIQESFYDGDSAIFGSSADRLTELRSYDDAGTLVHTRQLYYLAQGLNGRLSKERHQFAGPTAGSTALDVAIEYSYNPFGLLSRTTYPEGAPGKGGAFTLAYNYANGHLLEGWDAQMCGAPQAGDPPGQGCGCTGPGCTPQARAVLNPMDGVQKLTVPGNRMTQIDPDRRSRPHRIRIANSDLTDGKYDSQSFEYDGAGNISLMGANQYRYDGANRLVYVSDIHDSTIREQTFTYDPFGNMTQKALTLPSSFQDIYVVSPDTNRIVTHQSGSVASTFVYDARGNVTKGDSRVYELDAKNRIQSVRSQTSLESEIARYAYDASASRVRKDDRQRDLRNYYVRDVQGRLLSEFRRTQWGTYTPEWLKHYLYLGSRLVGLRENRVPSPPAGLAATTTVINSTQGSINLTWRANPSDEGVTPAKYRVYRSPNVDPPSWIIMASPNTNSYSDEVTRGVWYKYAVTAITQETVSGSTVERESYASDSLRFRVNSTSQTSPQPSTPGVPTKVPGDRSVFLKWTPHTNAANENVVGYHVYRGIGVAAVSKITQTPLVVPTFVNQGLTNGTTYRYAVTAINSSNVESVKTAEVSAVPADYTPPIPPLGFAARAACDGTSSVFLTWSPHQEALPTFTLYRDPPFTGGAQSIVVQGPTGYVDETTSANTLYTYWLKVTDGQNVSEESLHVRLWTRGTSALPTPSRPYAEGRDGAVSLRIPTSGIDPLATKMRVYRKRNTDIGCESYEFAGDVAPSAGSVLFPDGTLSNGVAYDYAVTSLRPDGLESGYSPTALGIPLKAPTRVSQCIEDLGATWKDGATRCNSITCAPGSTLEACRWRRLAVRWDFADLPEYQQLNATTGDGSQAYLMGYRIYVQKFHDESPDPDYTTLVSYQNDFQKWHCKEHPDISCHTDAPGICPAGDVCVVTSTIVDALGVPVADGVCEDGFTSCHGDWDCSEENRCIRRRVGLCASSGTRCFDDSNCTITQCSSRISPAEPYLVTYQDGGANTSVLKWDPSDGSCVAATAVYRVYVNGSWRLVESGYGDNYDPTRPSAADRCLQVTPDVCWNFLDPLYMCPVAGVSLPPSPTTPAVETPAPGAVRVSWEEPGTCELSPPDPCSSQNTCDPGFYCRVTGANGEGTCRNENPTSCSLPSFPCQGPGVACEPRGGDVAGYYIYAGEKGGIQYHFKPGTPVAATAATPRQFTFNGLAPTGAGGQANNFYFRVASFDGSGRISEVSPPSAFITPQEVSGATPVPASVKTVIWTQTTGPAPGRPAIKVSWQAGGTSQNPIGFRLWRSESETGTFCALIYDPAQQTLVCRPSGTLGATEVSTKNIDDTVVQGTTYFYKVTALDGSTGESGFSSVVAGRALPRSEKPLSPPASFRAYAPASQASFTGINLHWCPNPANEQVTLYRVYRSSAPMGPYLPPDAAGPGNLIGVISPHCLNGRWRCEILADGQVSESQTCLSETDARKCVVVDTTVAPATVGNQTVYYYVVTATRPDGLGGIEESPFSEENEGRPNLTDVMQPSFDPDAAAEVFCGDEIVWRIGPTESVSEPLALSQVNGTRGQADASSADSQAAVLAPYRVIGQEEPPPQDPVDLPDPDAAPRLVYFHLDHLGSPRVITDESGAVVSEHHYMPFGEEMPLVGQNSTNKRQFTGHEREADIGSDYMVARFYCPSLGRFLATDPLGDGFTYVSNDPINFVDPTGLWQCVAVCIGEGRKDCERTCYDDEPDNDGGDDGGEIVGRSYAAGIDLPPLQPSPTVGPEPEDEIEESAWERFLDCAADHYGVGGLVGRGAVAAGAIPLSKEWLGVPTMPGASKYTNPISYLGHQLLPEARIGTRILGTTRIFGILGRVNPYIGAGLLVYDAVSIGMCMSG
jgi:RHS repeat-associated protein